MEKYYAITKIDDVSIENQELLITRCETLNEAKRFPGTDVIVIENKMPGRDAKGSTFLFPNVYSYKIIDKSENPFLLKYRNTRANDFIIETFRSLYKEDEGWGELSILDKNNQAKTIRINAGYNDAEVFLNNIMQFLIRFETVFGSVWKFYELLNEKEEHIEMLEKENATLKDKLDATRLKLKKTKPKDSKPVPAKKTKKKK